MTLFDKQNMSFVKTKSLCGSHYVSRFLPKTVLPTQFTLVITELNLNKLKILSCLTHPSTQYCTSAIVSLLYIIVLP